METRVPVRFLDRHSPPHIATLVLITAVSSMSMNIFLASLPAMAIYFETTPAVLQYSISGYVFLSGVMQLVIGPLSDRYGRRRILLVSMSIFVVVSAGAAYSPNIEIFMLCRVLQTSIVSGIVLSRAIARDIVGATRSASFIGYITMGMALVPMVAPPIGGILQEYSGWRANFLVQSGAALMALILVYLDLGETASRAAGGFSRLFRMLPELIRSRRFWGYSATGAFSAGTFFAYLGGGPFVGAQVYGLEPGQIGFYFCFAPLGYFLGNGFSGRFAVRIGMRRMVIAGTIIMTLGMGASLLFLLAGGNPRAGFLRFHCFHRNREWPDTAKCERRNHVRSTGTCRCRVRNRRFADDAWRRDNVTGHGQPRCARNKCGSPARLYLVFRMHGNHRRPLHGPSGSLGQELLKSEPRFDCSRVTSGRHFMVLRRRRVV